MTASERIERLRQDILAQGEIRREEPELLWARSWMAHADESWHLVRRAHATADALRGLTPEIGPDDLIVGVFPSRELTPEGRAELDAWRAGPARAVPAALGQRAHMAIDYEKLLRLGLSGIRRQIDERRAALDLTRPDDLERDAFHRACHIALDGLGDLAAHYAAHARALAATERDLDRRGELLDIADVLDRVPEEPARTFREALQAMHLVTFALCAGQQMLLFQYGRPDRYLLPFYERDVATGALDEARAQELIDHLCLMLSRYTPRGLAIGFMVGGRDGSGRDVSNALTRLFLESIAHTRLSYPGIGLCWSDDTPQDIQRRACELLAEGLTHPAIFNDEVITRGMLDAGLPPAEACLYVQSTCVEITPIASSNVYVASPYINLPQLLLDSLGVAPLPGGTYRRGKGPAGGGALLNEAAEAGSGSQPPTFEALLAAYEARLAETIRLAVADENACQISRYYHGGFPLLSCFVNDCLARGLDIDRGGARHNWVEPSFVGLANLVDALAAIRRFVYEEGRWTLVDIAEGLRADFAEHEALRLQLLHTAAKYGNDVPEVDALAERITSTIARECRRYRTYLGGAFHPGFFCWVMHERLGAVTAATPDGRRAATALGDGSGPAQGRERYGPTAAILSATTWDHAPMLGGIAVNLRFTRPRGREVFVEGLRGLVNTFIARGGFEVQVNVVDTATLKAAQAHPEAYRDLVVRIGGYSDYFVGLSPRMQEEIIARTEHEGI